ncbi:hypothetical protein FOG51_00728 [Hanseniaspora uvarum]|nr:hypothetical protein FOG51_00728 [Hanseniaspora uvarum]
MSDSLHTNSSNVLFDREHEYLFGADEQDDAGSLKSNDVIINTAESQKSNSSSGYEDEDEFEDNNPFKGSTHMYSQGLQNSYNDQAVRSRRNIISSNPNVRIPPSLSYIKMPSLTSKDIEYLNTENIKELEQSIHTSEFYQGESNNDGFGRHSFIESKETEIKIIYAGKFQFTDGKIAIGYTILYNNQRVTRRYTDFVRLRQVLKKLLPTCIIPPIPERHTLISYILQPFQFSFNYNKTNGSQRFIDESDDTLLRRSRQFQMFLNLCLSKPKISECIVFKHFIDADFANWTKVMNQPPVTILPESNLQAPPLDPIKPSPFHLLLPIPKKVQLNFKANNGFKGQNDLESKNDMDTIHHLEEFNKSYINPTLRIFNNFKSHLESAGDYIAELGGYYNVASIETQIFNFQQNLTEEEYGLQDHSMNASILSALDRRNDDNRKAAGPEDYLNILLEKIGQLYDYNYIATQFLVSDLNISLKEQLEMVAKYNDEAISLIHFRESKIMQKRMVDEDYFVLNEKFEFLKRVQTLDHGERKKGVVSGEVASQNTEIEEEDLAVNESQNESEINISTQDESLTNILDENDTNDFVETVLMKNKSNSKAIQAAIKQYNIQKRQNAYKKIISDVSHGKTDKKDTKKKEVVTIEHTVMSKEKLKEDIDDVSKKLSHMEMLKQVVLKDMDEVNEEFEKEWTLQSDIYNDIWNKDILCNVETSVYAWANENLSHWENLLGELDV